MLKHKRNRKKTSAGQILILLGFVAVGAVCGILIVHYLDAAASTERSVGEELLSLGVLFLGMYALIYLHIIFHEAGHLLFGLLTGYSFSSFRIGSVMLVREHGHLRIRHLSIAGTGGQCLMAPPDLRDGELPVVLYHLGGVIVNIIVGALSLIGFLLTRGTIAGVLFLMSALIGAAYALINGLPLGTGLIDNDGKNALALRQDAKARRAFWVQMKVNERIACGDRLYQMPEEWFVMPDDEEMQNAMLAAIAVFSCNRLMDAHRFEEAEVQITRLLNMESAIAGIHRHLMICDLLYLELLGACRSEQIERMLDAEQKKLMRAMRQFPTVLRTEYVLALLWQKNEAEAEHILQKFEKCARTYPYPNDVESERELMRIAKAQALKVNSADTSLDA